MFVTVKGEQHWLEQCDCCRAPQSDPALQPWLCAPLTARSLGGSGSNDTHAGNAKFLGAMCKLLVLASLPSSAVIKSYSSVTEFLGKVLGCVTTCEDESHIPSGPTKPSLAESDSVRDASSLFPSGSMLVLLETKGLGTRPPRTLS